MLKTLPKGFVYLHEIDLSIVQSVRYAMHENFLGRPVDGYHRATIILSSSAAEALRGVQAELILLGYTLVVYDGYRPQRAVDDFVRWSMDINDQIAKDRYYPTVDKRDIFVRGYVGKKSGHTRGSTVDLTIMRTENKLRDATCFVHHLTNGEQIPFLDDGTENMGTSFDLFHEASGHDSPLIDTWARQQRNLLRDMMYKHGFKEYTHEWWHFTLIDEPFPSTYFDFVIE